MTSSIVGVLYNNVYIQIKAGAVQVKIRWAQIYIVLMAGRAADWNAVTVSAWTARCGKLFHVGIHLT